MYKKKRKPELPLLKGGDYLLFRFRSTIGVIRFNFSVRNGKRWSPYAVITLNTLKERHRKRQALEQITGVSLTAGFVYSFYGTLGQLVPLG